MRFAANCLVINLFGQCELSARGHNLREATVIELYQALIVAISKWWRHYACACAEGLVSEPCHALLQCRGRARQ